MAVKTETKTVTDKGIRFRPEEIVMSLDVPAELLARAERGAVTDEKFAECVRTSLPYAWQTVSRVVADLESSTGEFAETASGRAPSAARAPAPDG